MLRNNNDLGSMMELAWSFSSNSAILARLASRPDPREELPGGLKWIKPTIKEQLSAIGQTLETLGKPQRCKKNQAVRVWRMCWTRCWRFFPAQNVSTRRPEGLERRPARCRVVRRKVSTRSKTHSVAR